MIDPVIVAALGDGNDIVRVTQSRSMSDEPGNEKTTNTENEGKTTNKTTRNKNEKTTTSNKEGDGYTAATKSYLAA